MHIHVGSLTIIVSDNFASSAYLALIISSFVNAICGPVSKYISVVTVLKHWDRDKNKQHFADDIFKFIFWYNNLCILVEISIEFVPSSPVGNTALLSRMMACRQTGDKPLYCMCTNDSIVCWRICTSLGFSKFIECQDTDSMTGKIFVVFVVVVSLFLCFFVVCLFLCLFVLF